MSDHLVADALSCEIDPKSLMTFLNCSASPALSILSEFKHLARSGRAGAYGVPLVGKEPVSGGRILVFTGPFLERGLKPQVQDCASSSIAILAFCITSFFTSVDMAADEEDGVSRSPIFVSELGWEACMKEKMTCSIRLSSTA